MHLFAPAAVERGIALAPTAVERVRGAGSVSLGNSMTREFTIEEGDSLEAVPMKQDSEPTVDCSIFGCTPGTSIFSSHPASAWRSFVLGLLSMAQCTLKDCIRLENQVTLNLRNGVQKGKLGFPVFLKSGPHRGRIGFLHDARQYLPHGSLRRSGTIWAIVKVVKKQAIVDALIECDVSQIIDKRNIDFTCDIQAAEVAEIDYHALTKVLARCIFARGE